MEINEIKKLNQKILNRLNYVFLWNFSNAFGENFHWRWRIEVKINVCNLHFEVERFGIYGGNS